jgi:ATP-dependent helicase HrpA
MREWRDIHTQLLDALQEREDFKMTTAFHGLKTVDETSTGFGTPPYRAIHRSILAGLLGNIAQFDEENGNYKATHDRRVTLFPGSALFRRDEPAKRGGTDSARDGKNKTKSPRWVMAAEIMETSRLYARTCARLDPVWALDLGVHLLRISHSEPFWNENAGRVMVKQRTRLYGLEIESRAVGYGRIDPVHATEIFIREALVNDTVTYPFDFIAHNRRVREQVEAALTRTRDAGYLNLDEAAYRFYARHLLSDSTEQAPISSIPELITEVRERRAAEPQFLMMEADDLRDPESLAHDAESYPVALPLDNAVLPLHYAYKPGQSDDGVTLDVNVREAETLTQAALDWAVPGHLEQKVEHYLRVLPKELRRAFVPLAETAKSLSTQIAQRDRLTGRRETIPEALIFQIAERFRVAIDPAIWAGKPPPEHLRVRVRVLDDKGRELCSSRELADIHSALHAHQKEASASIAHAEPEVWRRARATVERPAQSNWAFADIPPRVLVTEQAGVPVYAFPALVVEKDGVALRLLKTAESADAETERGLARLLELELSRDLGWLERDLRALRELGALSSTLVPLNQLQGDAFEMLRRWLTNPDRIRGWSNPRATESGRPCLSAKDFAQAVDSSRRDLQGLVPRVFELLREILSLRQSLLVHPQPYPGLEQDLGNLISPVFLRDTPYPQLAHFARYLKAMKLRADRWKQSPPKDAERAAQLAPFVAALARFNSSVTSNGNAVPSKRGGIATRGESSTHPSVNRRAIEAFRWLIEEFRVSLFAQELGTAEPVSAAKLNRAVAELQTSSKTPAGSVAVPEAKPILVAPLAEKKSASVKSLGALDKLFPR